MPLEPRFRRVAALNRRFVDREGALAAFAQELDRIGDGPRVLNVTGIGGIGKSRLLREFRDRAVYAGHRTAVLDLQVPAHRQQEDALAVLRTQFGGQNVRFDRYDIAYAVLWQRLHPHLRISRAELPFIEESTVLSDILDGTAGVPVFGTAVRLIRILDRVAAGQRRKHRIKADDTLGGLDSLPNSELIDTVTYLFAEDLRAASAERPYTIFVDAYEALGRRADIWLRDIVVQLDRGLTVIASREPIDWTIYDPEWGRVTRTVGIEGLPMDARLQLLADNGIAEPTEQRIIAEASAGVPFYLHLAVDTRQGMTGVVSAEEILQRFLQHVGPDEIRFLELLGVARTFDFEIFQAVARAFQLPAHRMAWDSLTSYSFVYPADGEFVQLHQLMATALRGRLREATVRDVHRVLWRAWGRRTGPRALREAAYHGVAAGELSDAELLAYADRIKTSGGARGIAGLVADLQGKDGTGETIRCLTAEEAILLGDAARAVALTPIQEWRLDTPSGARLAVAAAHARRIAGETADALTIYTQVWTGHDGSARLDAGLWAADLHMAQGRFRRAAEVADEVRAACPPDDREQFGDVARLLHLAHRFSYDFAGASGHLEKAAERYEEAGAVFGLGAIQTNRAELLAWIDPRKAVDAAADAIATHTDLAALHELGKAYTALGLAQIKLGRLDEADAALKCACDALDRAGYRSGRARAELFRAFLLARQGRPAPAASSARWAVDELLAVEVYPTLILTAERLLTHLGLPDQHVTMAAEAARTGLQPFDSLTSLEERMRKQVADLLGLPDLYRAAVDRLDAAAGFYNRNVRVDTDSGPVNVRIPIDGADVMDLRIWPEHRVLAAVEPHLDGACPRLLLSCPDPPFQVHSYVSGELLDDLAPRGLRVPSFVPDDVTALFRRLADVPGDVLPAVPTGWPEETPAFASRLSGLTAEVHERFADQFAAVFFALGFPADPLAPVRWDGLTARPFRLVHADVHRKNMIVTGGRTVFLDWELALWGDPVYELAVHFHKMAYQPDERETVLNKWLAAMPGGLTDGWERDLDAYLRHERVKSAVVDTVRYTQLISAGTLSAEQEQQLIDKLTTKIGAAAGIWQTGEPPTRERVDEILRSWAPDV